MRVSRPTPPRERAIVELALRQHGVIGRRQLLALGLGRRAIAYRLRTGRLRAVHPRVYAGGAAPLTREGRFMAAVLACGEGAVLSHRSAADLWRMRPQAGGPVEVIVPSDGGRKLPGIAVHRSVLGASEVTELHGIPVTTPARTLIDLADVLPRRALERAIDEAEYLRLDCAGLAPRPGRRGSGKLAAVLAEHRAGATRTRSELEELFLQMRERHGIARPEVNAHVEGYEVDFLWRAERLILEADGRDAHMTRRAFERDRRRDAQLLVAGFSVLRVTGARLRREPDGVMAEILALLRRSRRAAPGARGRR